MEILEKSKDMTSDKKIVTFSKRTDKYNISKTVEKISNGYLVTLDKYYYGEQSKDNKDEHIKKFYPNNPLDKDITDNKDDIFDDFEILTF